MQNASLCFPCYKSGRGNKFNELLPASAHKAPRKRPFSIPIDAVATTHDITTSIMGVGCPKDFNPLKMNFVEPIQWSWVVTIPANSRVA
jgi:hypothetical protein